MRPSQKSGRGRGKGNRGNKNHNQQGHSANRVYDSAGPEGKVRGTPQQIVDKYQGLARDAQLSGDRVTAENFLQHAEHYVRILSTIQEAEEKRREQQQQNNQNSQNHQNNANGRDGGHRDGGQRGGGDQPGNQQPQQTGNVEPDAVRHDGQQADGQHQDRSRDEGQRDNRNRDSRRRNNNRKDAPQADMGEQPSSDGLAALDAAQGQAPEIVDTPETQAKPRTRRARPKAPEKATENTVEIGEAETEGEAPAPAPAKRAPRARKKPAAPEGDDSVAAADEPSVEETT